MKDSKKTGNFFRGTTQEFADLLKIEYLLATNLLKFLELKGEAAVVSQKKAVKQGRPSNIYLVNLSVNLNFAMAV